LPRDAKRIFKKAQEKNLFFAKDRICFMFFITFNGRLLVNLIDKSKFDIRLWSLLQRKHCKIALKSQKVKFFYSRQSLNLTRIFNVFSDKTRLNFIE